MSIELWRWRLLMQSPKREGPKDSFAEATRAILKTDRNITPGRLMIRLRCGYRRAEKLLKEERGY